MPGKQIPRVLFFLVGALALAQCLHDYPLLPERMASHFGPSGLPNGWMTKSQFFIAYAIVLLPALFVEFWLHRRISKMPGAKLNLPNKEYWLAPERRDATFAYFETFFAWYGCAFLFVISAVMGMAMRANLDAMPKLPTAPTVSLVIGFVLFNLVAIGSTYWRFWTRH